MDPTGAEANHAVQSVIRSVVGIGICNGQRVVLRVLPAESVKYQVVPLVLDCTLTALQGCRSTGKSCGKLTATASSCMAEQHQTSSWAQSIDMSWQQHRPVCVTIVVHTMRGIPRVEPAFRAATRTLLTMALRPQHVLTLMMYTQGQNSSRHAARSAVVGCKNTSRRRFIAAINLAQTMLLRNQLKGVCAGNWASAERRNISSGVG